VLLLLLLLILSLIHVLSQRLPTFVGASPRTIQIVAIGATIIVIIYSILALTRSLGVSADVARAWISLAVFIVAIRLAIFVVVFTVEAKRAFLSAIPLAIRVVAISATITIIVESVMAFATSLGVRAAVARARISLAIVIVAISFAIAVVIFVIETQGSRLVAWYDRRDVDRRDVGRRVGRRDVGGGHATICGCEATMNSYYISGHRIHIGIVRALLGI
jgi:hypothetical protein